MSFRFCYVVRMFYQSVGDGKGRNFRRDDRGVRGIF